MARTAVVTPNSKQIKERRQFLGLSAPAVAAKMGPGRAAKTIYQIEYGIQVRVSRRLMAELAHALEQPIDELIVQDAAA
jgi:transcriptional regulator with XRE-family HTH domain